MKRRLARLLTVVALVTISVSAVMAVGGGSARKIKDEIIFAQSSDITTLDPIVGTQERAYSITNHMYDTLLSYDSNMKLLNCLATKYEWVDNLTLKMYLRKDVKFHNGTKLTAQDVLYSYDLRAARGAACTTYISKVEAKDDYTVVFHFSSPHPSFIYQLTDPAFAIVPKAYHQSVGPKGFAAKPIGSGPYKLKEYVTGDHYTLERFDEYWGGPAKTKYLTMKVIPEAGQRTILLETGQIDVAYEVPFIDINKIKENPDLQFLSIPSMKIVMFFVNCKSKSPVSNNLVRQAMEYAIDKDSIVKSVLYGFGKTAYAIVPETVFEYKAVVNPHTYNLQKAKELMKKAGYEKGFDMEIWTPGTQTNTEVCQVIQDQLAAININAKILVQDANTIDSREDAGDDFGMALHFYQCNSGHAEYTLSNILPTGTLRNDSRFSNAEYDAAYYKWLVTTEPKARDALLTKMYAIQNEETPVIPIYNEVKILGATKNLEGLQLSRIGAHEYQNAVVYVK
jgi:peptide/nickel transport system substrate-binding protein